MARLKIRIKRRTTLPGGIFTWQLNLRRNSRATRRCPSNMDALKPIIELLDGDTCMGKYRLDVVQNWRKAPIATALYLTHKSDVALIKMCYSDAIRDIYQLELVEDDRAYPQPASDEV
jgi:hypothetical protein